MDRTYGAWGRKIVPEPTRVSRYHITVDQDSVSTGIDLYVRTDRVVPKTKGTSVFRSNVLGNRPILLFSTGCSSQ